MDKLLRHRVKEYKSERVKAGRKYQKGQALLIVLLTMAVILTVVLSVVSRSVTDITVTTYEESSLRAFSAAEAGIEKALLNTTVPIFSGYPDSSDNSVSYSGGITSPSEADQTYSLKEGLSSGEVATFWLVSHNNDGSLTCGEGKPCFAKTNIHICWGNPDYADTKQPAVEIMVYYDTTTNSVDSPNNYSNVKVARYAYSPNDSDKYAGWAKVTGGCDWEGDLYKHKAVMKITDVDSSCNIAGCPLMVKVRMYYSNLVKQKIGIQTSGGTENLPSQGLEITSTGTAGDTSRRVTVTQRYPENPTFFDAAVFSMKDIIK